MLPDCQWHTGQKGEEPLSWFPVPYMVSRHTWSTCSYQRVSTFASGSSSVSVCDAWRLTVSVRVRPACGEKPAKTPLTYKEASRRGKVRKNFRLQEVAFTVPLTSKATEWHASDSHFDIAGHITRDPNGET